jgi:hypothetical protein
MAKQAKLYSGIREEPRIYSVEMLEKAGAKATRPLPSVTTILRIVNKPAFVPAAQKAMGDYLKDKWDVIYFGGGSLSEEEFKKSFDGVVDDAKKAWGARSKSAMDIGTRIHKLCEAYARGEFPNESALTLRLEEEPEQVRNGFDAYLAWVEETGFVASEVEKVIAGDGYAGTVDAVGVLRDGTRVLVDWKSGVGGNIYHEYILQWNAYAAPLSIESGFIVAFDRDTGEASEYPMKFDTVTYSAFLSARNLWEWMEEHKK